ncbi:MAG TPA: hypothetical protein VMR25_27400 [Planctomycetaceae bacterium]|jgi:hypothetical protein|nr:hypothetical protein [Planctomycetaceae bacterium]
MALGVRQRILLTLLPAILVVAAVVGAGLDLMNRLEQSLPAAVLEKSDRVVAVEDLGGDFHRLDASFQSALNGSVREARDQYAQIWRDLNQKLADAEHRADADDERELFTRITRLADDYRRQGDAFYAPRESAATRSTLYYGPHGLLATLEQLKRVLTEAFSLEQASMTTSMKNAHFLVVNSLLSVEVMIAVTLVLTGLATGFRIRAILRPDTSAAYDAKDVRTPPEPDFSGPICLCAISVWLAVVAAWNTYDSRPVSSSAAALLTPRGAAIYRPEYDIPIYMAGLAVAVLAAVGWAWVWQRSWQAANTDRRRRHIARLLKFHKWWVFGCIALASVFPNGRLLNVYSAALAALAAVLLWYEARRTGNDVARSSLGPRGPRQTSTGSRSRPGGRAKRSAPAQLATLSGSSPMAGAVESDRAQRSQAGRWWGMAAIGTVTLLVFIPDSTKLVASCWTEHFHHWNYYVVGPFLGFEHGAALGSQSYTQYGVGWPLVVSVLSRIHPLSYEWLLESASVYGCIYFVLLFFFLRSLTGRTAWAFVGLFLSLFLQMFNGTNWPMWVAPSSTVLRAPLDLIVYWTALKHARSGDARWGWLIGGAAGAGLLFGSDTGVYVIAAVLFYGLLCWGYRPAGKRQLTLPFVGSTGLALCATFLGGLSWASRGTCFQAAFWPKYWEAILFYSGGMSSLPMSLGMERPQEFLLLLAALTTYTFAIAFALFRWLIHKLDPTDLVLALVAASGLGMLILFINRSHPFNVYHPIIPFCILVTHYVSRWAASASDVTSAAGATGATNGRTTGAVPIAIIGVLLVALACNGQVHNYPSLLAALLPSFGSEQAVTPGATADAGRTASVDYRAEMRPLVEVLQKLSDGGRHSVAVVAQGETVLLFLADAAPYFRYSPLELIDQRQVASVERTIIDHPPEFILFGNDWPTEMRRRWEKFLGERYHIERQVQDGWFVLRRIPPRS